MIEVSINNISKSYGGQTIFQDIRFDILEGERIGLIGANGCGKTTLLRLIQSEEEPDSGTIIRRKGVRIRCLDQMPEFGPDATVDDICAGAFAEVDAVRRRLRALEAEMTGQSGTDLEQTLRRYSRGIEEFDSLQGYETETRTEKVLQGLSIGGRLRAMPFSALSGGEKTRVALARLLLEEPDVLLLDEPTNHLDIDSMEWLEGFLSAYRGTILLVSHDRQVLDRAVNRIVELHPDRAEEYIGGYQAYLVEKDARFRQAMHAYLNQQKKIERMEQQIERYKIWGAMRSSEKMERAAKVLERKLEKIDRLDMPVQDRMKPRLGTKDGTRSGKEVLRVDELGHAFGDHAVLRAVSFDLFRKDRACILGPNGSGKTTLLRLILGDLGAGEDTVRVGASVKIGYLPQTVSFGEEDQTMLDWFSRTHDLTTGQARTVLARALFCRDDVFRRIRILSGGERSRLKLLSLCQEDINFLVLDEPTNHLDVESREVLESMLEDFPGTLLFVSHDRYFIRRLASRILVLEDGALASYEMDYDRYREQVRRTG